VVLTSTRDVTVYRGAKQEVAERIRVVRSLGGPLANALIGLAALAFAAPWPRMFGVFNLCIAAWTLAPVPTMDGWIVWRWAFRRKARLTP
jgi:Zn-dependent protease